MKKYGYIRARKLSEVEAFLAHADVDKEFVDLTNNYGGTGGQQQMRMFDQLQKGDTVVISSLYNTCSDISEICSFIGSLRNKGANLVTLDSVDGSFLLGHEGYKVLTFLKNFLSVKEDERAMLEVRKMGRRPSIPFPDGFYETYLDFRNGRLNAKKAAEELGITNHQFYTLVRNFE
jgi:DNA invertase Pin-like site-specific DNA recombinase